MSVILDRSQLLIVAGFFFVLVFVGFTYSPLLNTPFILDDVSNFELFKVVSTFDDWQDILLALQSNESGPLGRPVSMLSYLLVDFTWPTSPHDHRVVNLYIHLMNGVLLYCLLFNLVSLKSKDSFYYWLILLFTFGWLILPINSNVIFSVVQRMTSLAAMFTLIMLNLYVYWRAQYFSRSKLTDLLFVILILVSFCLSVLSKEVGFLSLGYLILIETLLVRLGVKQLSGLWRLLCLSLIVCFFGVLIFVNAMYFVNESVWMHRAYTPLERLLSQSIIVPEYAQKILTFKVGGVGLYEGSMPIQDWFDRGRIVKAIIFWLLILTAVIWSPWWCQLGLVWFLTGHLLESVSLPLEPYFEHRNYLPSIGLLSVPLVLISFLESRKVLFFIGGGFCFYAFVLHANFELLHEPGDMLAIYAHENPKSERAVINYSNFLMEHGLFEESEKILNTLEYSKVSYSIYLLSCIKGEVSPLPRDLVNEIVDAKSIAIIRSLLANYRSGVCQNSIDEIIGLLEAVSDRKDIRAKYHQMVLFELSKAYAEKGFLDGAIQTLDRAIAVKDARYLWETRAFWLASAGLNEGAISSAKTALKMPSKCRYVEFPCDRKMIDLINFYK